MVSGRGRGIELHRWRRFTTSTGVGIRSVFDQKRDMENIMDRKRRRESKPIGYRIDAFGNREWAKIFGR